MTATKGDLMDRADAIQAAGTMRAVWQQSRCACGCGGSWNAYVTGTIGDRPAVWMGCARRSGSCVGGGLTGKDYYVAMAVVAAAERLGCEVQDLVDPGAKARHATMLYDMERAERERPMREAAKTAFAAAVERRMASYRPLYEAALAKCRTRTDGQPHGGDVAAVREAYRAATGEGQDGAYPDDLAYGLRRLTRMAEQGPGAVPVITAL